MPIQVLHGGEWPTLALEYVELSPSSFDGVSGKSRIVAYSPVAQQSRVEQRRADDQAKARRECAEQGQLDALVTDFARQREHAAFGQRRHTLVDAEQAAERRKIPGWHPAKTELRLGVRAPTAPLRCGSALLGASPRGGRD